MNRFIGLDVGTGNLVAAETRDGKFEYHKVKDMFFKVDPKSFMDGSAMDFGETMLKKSGANYVKIDGVLYILGDDAFKFANLFHRECLRPMSRGVLNPQQPESTIMVAALIGGIAGKAATPNDIIYHSMPADPIDSDFDVAYHASVVRGVLSDLGYSNIYKMNEGLAVVYSELEKEQYTGVGMSFGAGMINVCYSFLGMPIFSFSIARSGDWIDNSVATAMNETANVVQQIKESGIDLFNPKTNVQNAISVYYISLLDYVVNSFKKLYASTDPKKLPNITQPIKIVVSGGTAMPKGFIEKLKKSMESGFPIPVSEVVLAKDAFYAVARGLYNAAKVKAETGG